MGGKIYVAIIVRTRWTLTETLNNSVVHTIYSVWSFFPKLSLAFEQKFCVTTFSRSFQPKVSTMICMGCFGRKEVIWMRADVFVLLGYSLWSLYFKREWTQLVVSQWSKHAIDIDVIKLSEVSVVDVLISFQPVCSGMCARTGDRFGMSTLKFSTRRCLEFDSSFLPIFVLIFHLNLC